MEKNPLQIVATEKSSPKDFKRTLQSTRTEMQAKMERLWLQNPNQFDPLRNNMEREGLKRIDKILSNLDSANRSAVDLGCGYGYISRMMRDKGWKVQALDIASNALKAFKEKGDLHIELLQDALPCTKLEDDLYDLVVCTNVIGYLDPKDYRLLMAELSRLVKREGHVLCSTSIDINSEDAMQRFNDLAETEFQIEQWNLSYHLLLLRLIHFFEIPLKYIEAHDSNEILQVELHKRKGFSRTLFKLNTSKIGRFFWTPFQFLAIPFLKLLKENRWLTLFLEKICYFFWDSAGISHATFIGKRRPLIAPTQADLASIERKGKRQVWE